MLENKTFDEIQVGDSATVSGELRKDVKRTNKYNLPEGERYE